MTQVGLDQQWLYFLRQYIRPMQEKLFTGYVHDVSASEFKRITGHLYQLLIDWAFAFLFLFTAISPRERR